ncbi:hypothetical protein TNCV_817381 [Trichonephila clavipes]|nr:hypothetical protein TNCV_817381 [Trichonephila clavipes]
MVANSSPALSPGTTKDLQCSGRGCEVVMVANSSPALFLSSPGATKDLQCSGRGCEVPPKTSWSRTRHIISIISVKSWCH